MQLLNKGLKKNMDKISVQNLEAKARDTTLDKEVRNQYRRISERFVELENRQQEMNGKLEEKIMTNLVNNRNQ